MSPAHKLLYILFYAGLTRQIMWIIFKKIIYSASCHPVCLWLSNRCLFCKFCFELWFISCLLSRSPDRRLKQPVRKANIHYPANFCAAIYYRESLYLDNADMKNWLESVSIVPVECWILLVHHSKKKLVQVCHLTSFTIQQSLIDITNEYGASWGQETMLLVVALFKSYLPRAQQFEWSRVRQDRDKNSRTDSRENPVHLRLVQYIALRFV